MTGAVAERVCTLVTRLFRELRSNFDIQPVVVQEVETELRWTKHHRNRFEAHLKKAISTGCLAICDVSFLQTHLGAPATATFSGIQTLGRANGRHVGAGEAYTHAAALTLGVPALSNDFSAIRVLQHAGFQLPSPVLRFFGSVSV